MAKLTVGRMAKLYGLHRSTLYEALDKGRISFGLNGHGQRVIDMAEMLRVYGEPPSPARQQAQGSPTPDSGALLGQMAELVRVVERQSQQLEALRREVAELRALPAPPQAPAAEPPRGEVRSMADVLARFSSRRAGE